MKARKIVQLAALTVLIAVAAACQKEVTATVYTHTIPADATEVAAIDLKGLTVKSGLTDKTNADLRERLLTLIDEARPGSDRQALQTLIDDPSETGIDWAAPAYLFHSPAMKTNLLTLKISDSDRWQTIVNHAADEVHLSKPVERDGYFTADLLDAGIRLAYNNGTLLMVYGESTARQDKWLPALTALMKQPAEQSIHRHPHFAHFAEQKGDIKVLLTPDALPFVVRGLLNRPVGTQLTGFVLFENGRIYATVQEAGFEGKTAESNQPVHPQNSRELQQALGRMTGGAPFNIELSNDELLTLTNLRVLMEFAANDPQVQALSAVVSRIESIQMRGDSRQTRFTVVLSEKNTNALQQFVSFAKGWIEQAGL